MSDDKLIASIKEHEGLMLHAYFDTNKKITVGYGRNLSDVGISVAEAEMLFNNDIASVRQQLRPFAWYKIQDEVRAGVIVELCFNIGLDKLLDFQNMISALKVLDYKKAASEMVDSQWAKEVSFKRSNDMYNRMLYGVYQ